jgi:hypothetical protein
MAKKSKKSKVTVKCQCSTCGQVAHAQENTTHNFCKGIRLDILARMPAQFQNLTNPNRKGTWLRYVEPAKVEAA